MFGGHNKNSGNMIIAKEINDKIYIYSYKNKKVYCFNKRLARLLVSFLEDKNTGGVNYSEKEIKHYYEYFKKEHFLS